MLDDAQERNVRERPVLDIQLGGEDARSRKPMPHQPRQQSPRVVRRLGDTGRLTAPAQLAQRDAVDELEDAEGWEDAGPAAGGGGFGEEDPRNGHVVAHDREDAHFLGARLGHSVVEPQHESLGGSGQSNAVVPVHDAAGEGLDLDDRASVAPRVEEGVSGGDGERWRRGDDLPGRFVGGLRVRHEHS